MFVRTKQLPCLFAADIVWWTWACTGNMMHYLFLLVYERKYLISFWLLSFWILSWWQHATNLASYEQQDAHEFFISILDHIHENIKDDQPKSHEQGDGDCCIAHRVFSGILRSDVICTNCGFSSTTFEPCMDVSLDLDSGHNNCLGVANPKPHARNGMSSKVSTLMRCLERFTRAERLDAEQKYFCERCKERQVSLKQMSIRRLPLVSCFHIKRFEHSTVKKMSRKVDHSLQFPFSLDMTPYLSSSILRSRYGNRIFPSEACDSDAVSELPSEFEIFAVITHSGKLDAGHYVTYLRLNNQWYRCDDAWVTRVDEHTVRSSQAYMLFYVQKTLYYKACERAAAVWMIWKQMSMALFFTTRKYSHHLVQHGFTQRETAGVFNIPATKADGQVLCSHWPL